MRELSLTLPSASEYSYWNSCQAKWALAYRCAISVREKGVRLLTGSALSEAMEQFYLPSSDRTPSEMFDKYMYDARRMHETCPEEEWQAAFSEARQVLELYLATYSPDRFGKVLAVQKKIDTPCPMKLDLVVQDVATGEIYPVEQKSISGWADITYENLKYDLDPQPILYTLGIVNEYQVECKKAIIDYLIKPIPAKGKYKAKLPQLAEYTVPVPLWKQDMILTGIINANEEMKELDATLDELKFEQIPRRTNNCVMKMGSRTFLCDYYEACSLNVNPLELPGFQGRS